MYPFSSVTELIRMVISVIVFLLDESYYKKVLSFEIIEVLCDGVMWNYYFV